MSRVGLRSRKNERYLLDVVVEKDKDGYFVHCPLIQGCVQSRDTYEEALENIKDAIKLHIEDLADSKQPFPHPKLSVSPL